MELILFETNGVKNLKIYHNSKTITIHSSNPLKEAERIATHFNPLMEYVIIAGFGLGYIVRYLIENTKFKILVYEHSSEIIEFAKKYQDLGDLLDSQRLKIFFDMDGLFNFLEENYIKEFNFYIHRPYMTLFPQIYSNIEGILGAYLSKKYINQNTLKRFQKTWLKNIIKNSIYYFRLPGINQIKHNFKNKPAVIVGAGPSLQKNVDLLREFQKKLLIISTDTALGYLEEKGIVADFVVSVDPQDKNSLYLSGVKKDTAPFLVADSATSFITFSRYPLEKIIIFDTIFPLYNELKIFWGEKGSLKSGGSVSTTAFDLARFFGCNPIIFVGQDLAYTGLKTHSYNNFLEKILFLSSTRLNNFETFNAKSLISADRISVRGNVEKFVFTDRKFLTFIDWFRKEAELTDSELINATEGGAYIEGFKVSTLEETIEKYNIQKGIEKKFEVYFNENDKEISFVNFLDEILQIIDKLIPLSKKAVNSSRKMLEKFGNSNEFQGFIEDMNEFDFNLLKVLKAGLFVGRFLELTMQSSIQKLLERREEDLVLSKKLVENWFEFYLEASSGLSYIKHLILKRLKMKL